MDDDTTKQTKFIKKKYEKKILYPYFIECSNYTLDDYWKQIFVDLAKCKNPKHVYYNDKNKLVIIKIVNDVKIQYELKGNPNEDFIELKKHFQSYLHLRSSTDKQDIRSKMKDIRDKIDDSYDVEWKGIRKKNVKEAILRSYLLQLKEKHKLSNIELKQLIKTINIGFCFSWINDNTIVYIDKQIEDITNLIFDEKKRMFYINKPNTIIKRTVEIKTNKISDFWKKSLKNPKNRYVYK